METEALNHLGQVVKISQEEIESLKKEVRGPILLPSDQGFDEARKVWNGMIDRHPAFIVECTGTADVINAVRFAKRHQLLISVRGAGHNIAGKALQNKMMLIDLSHMRSVSVNPEDKTVIVSPGATLADVDHETQSFGLALPMGINSTTGISGLTLGGGFGWLSRAFGLTIDNLLAIEAVTVEGKRLIADRDHFPDLFWAVRGGGGNFAIVTSFKFKLHQAGPEMFCGPVVFDIEEGKRVLANYRTFCKKSNEKTTVWAVLRHCPPFPFVDSSHHGKKVLILVGVYNGPIEEGQKELSPLKGLGSALGAGLSPHRFKDFQQAFDPMLTPGARNYWKSHNFKEIPDGLIDVLIKYCLQLPSDESEIFIGQMGGATNRIPADATAYPHRDVSFIMNVHTRWRNASDDKRCANWAKEFYQETLPFATGGIYANFVSEGDDNIESAYAQNGTKLAEIKAKYDPSNILRSNLNLPPKS